jgi:hypothetical protein
MFFNVPHPQAAEFIILYKTHKNCKKPYFKVEITSLLCQFASIHSFTAHQTKTHHGKMSKTNACAAETAQALS